MLRKASLIIFTILLSNNALGSFDNNQCKELIIEAEKIIDQESLPGIAMAILDEEKTLCKKFYGYVNKSGKKIAGDTIFPIASLTKGFLGSILSIMSDQKQFNWNWIISEELKEFKLKNHKYNQELSFHHLASMQTGLPAFAMKDYLEKENNPQDIIANIPLIDSIYPPGIGKFAYQYALLVVFEEMIKKRTGQEWDKLLQKKILDPMKLINTGIDITSLKNKSDVVVTYNQNNEQIDWEKFQIKSAAGMYSSLDDLIRWTKLHIMDGNFDNKQLISKSEISKMRNNYTVIEDFQHLFLDMNYVKELSYGRFWRNYYYKNFKIIEHNGLSSGSSSIICYIPNKKIAIAILTNKATNAPSLIREKFLQLILKD